MQQEKALATLALAFTVVVVVWKSLGHLSVVPGWDVIWGDAPEAQYPRRVTESDTQWQYFYLVLYGVLGTAAQYAGFRISTDTTNRQTPATTPTNQTRAKMLGFFHVAIGIHHVVWAATKASWGRLQLDHLQLPFYFLGGVAALGAFWHGLQLLLTKESSKLKDVIRHKVLVDATSLMTLIELVGFLVANWFGNYRNDTYERFLWLLTFVTPILMFVVDFVETYSAQAARSRKKA